MMVIKWIGRTQDDVGDEHLDGDGDDGGDDGDEQWMVQWGQGAMLSDDP